ncbi:signal peptide peptidase SppA [Alteromonas sp. a30]|uniref:signal peptide peptidase SppA n=1 Tax=Alteromonas sp. a30 TaxID=2730917 RepID=UPI00227F404C|nr:signal peptide peptidase SppA [Alteromonas sp. a30]MCY7294018.1 signal peptide peptidase SppA [Alteromonas sp. a30]
MASEKSWFSRFFIGIWSILNFSRRLFFNLIFIFIAIAIIAAIFADDGKIAVPKESAFILNLSGNIVIEKEMIDPFDEILMETTDQQPSNPEVLLRDVVFAIDEAAGDARIKTMILSLGGLKNAGQDKLREIARAIERFKASGKPVYAIGDFYTQTQYYLASHADHLYLNPMGMVLIEGYGRYRMYFKSALEKLKAKAHIFKVGTFKSAIEPFIRDDMSDAAKEANKAWLSSLWQQYKADVASARRFDINNFDEDIQAFKEKFAKSNNDFAQFALDNQWVDALKTREAIRVEMVNLVGGNDTKIGFNHVSYEEYLKSVKSPFNLNKQSQNIGIVVAKGTIFGGNQKPGTIGGDSTARLLRKARLDDSINAVVLHVDSPGGSAFASEVIRQEIELLKEANKPVVAMMSSLAASGGYWISASADQIWASPSTITGSIGIFGMFLTYEDSLKYLGIQTDGIGTTDFVGLSPSRTLNPDIADVFQRSTERGYEKFISLVAKERDMTKERVDEIAQGRVWIGEKAKEIGLVDELGTLDEAITSAAQLANIENYGIEYVEPTLSGKELFWKEFFDNAGKFIVKHMGIKLPQSTLFTEFNKVSKELETFTKFNDPYGTYAYCLMCEL